MGVCEDCGMFEDLDAFNRCHDCATERRYYEEMGRDHDPWFRDSIHREDDD